VTTPLSYQTATVSKLSSFTAS